jgi:predicted O-methyltransferase YrrM
MITGLDNLGLIEYPGLFDMVFVLGDLPGNNIPDYFSLIMQHIHNDSVLILCNIHGSKKLQEVWNKIKNHSSVTLTIDLFNMGLVFCKEELTKEDFILRY